MYQPQRRGRFIGDTWGPGVQTWKGTAHLHQGGPDGVPLEQAVRLRRQRWGADGFRACLELPTPSGSIAVCVDVPEGALGYMVDTFRQWRAVASPREVSGVDLIGDDELYELAPVGATLIRCCGPVAPLMVEVGYGEAGKSDAGGGGGSSPLGAIGTALGGLLGGGGGGGGGGGLGSGLGSALGGLVGLLGGPAGSAAGSALGGLLGGGIQSLVTGGQSGGQPTGTPVQMVPSLGADGSRIVPAGGGGGTVAPIPGGTYVAPLGGLPAAYGTPGVAAPSAYAGRTGFGPADPNAPTGPAIARTLPNQVSLDMTPVGLTQAANGLLGGALTPGQVAPAFGAANALGQSLTLLQSAPELFGGLAGPIGALLRSSLRGVDALTAAQLGDTDAQRIVVAARRAAEGKVARALQLADSFLRV